MGAYRADDYTPYQRNFTIGAAAGEKNITGINSWRIGHLHQHLLLTRMRHRIKFQYKWPAGAEIETSGIRRGLADTKYAPAYCRYVAMIINIHAAGGDAAHVFAERRRLQPSLT